MPARMGRNRKQLCMESVFGSSYRRFWLGLRLVIWYAANMLEHITYNIFESILGETIDLKVGEICFQAKVDRVDLLRENPDQQRQPFSVELLADNTENYGQQIYEINHPALGDVSLFAVPLGPDKEGMRYQILFN